VGPLLEFWVNLMADALIENPILKLPFLEPTRHFKFTDGGISIRKAKAAKVMTASTLWVPAVNNHGAFGRRAFQEVNDPYDALVAIRLVVSRVAHSTSAGEK
jgi:hypothetical protein